MEPADAVLRFLESVGRRSDAEFYLALFRAEPKERFAAISVDANVARHANEAVTLDLRFLAALGLTPLVVLGLLDSMEVAEHAARIRRRLERAGVPAEVVSWDDRELSAHAATAARSGTIPIVPLGAAGGALSAAQIDERFGRLGCLLSALRTRKLIFLHRPGGLRQRGTLVNLVNLTTEYDAILASREISRKERAMVIQSRRLVLDVPHKLLVAITSPLDLLRELFTVKGAGTLLRRGAHIERRAGIAEIDRERLRALLASSFGRPPTDGFFERPVSCIFLEEGYRGAAIMRDTPLGAYLTKFAVDREAQGEGMGRDLWERMVADHATVFWRARPDNPIGAWYIKQCDGMARFPEWHVFWKGLAPRLIPDAIEYCRAQEIDIPPEIE
jgi:acetylglutamate kinase